MITSSILKQQTWMESKDEFNQIMTNSKKVPKLSSKFVNYQYVE